MAGGNYERARRIRDSNTATASITVLTGATLAPLVFDFVTWSSVPELALTLSWWLGTAVLTTYSGFHVLAAVADTRRFLDDYGTEYATGPVVFCHALGQRLFTLLGVAFALVFLAITGAGTEAPLVLLVTLGLFAASLIGLSVAVPMNRRVSKRLTEYRDR